MRLLLINPNTSEDTNQRIRKTAEQAVGAGHDIQVTSAPSGIRFIETAKDSEATVPAVLEVVRKARDHYDAIVISAFSDPGLLAARRLTVRPVYGIAQAAMQVAAKRGRSFAIVTLGETLREVIKTNAYAYGFADYLEEVHVLPWQVREVSARPEAFRKLFMDKCNHLAKEKRVGAVIIGGGPLSGLADAISPEVSVPILDGVRCASQLAVRGRGEDRRGHSTVGRI